MFSGVVETLNVAKSRLKLLPELLLLSLTAVSQHSSSPDDE